MELNDTLRVMVRRWYVLLLGLALSAGLGWVVHVSVPTSYEADTSILLMPAETVVDEEVGNPYLYMGGMADALDVLVIRAGAEQVRADVLDDFPGADYTIGSHPTTPTPIVDVTAEGASGEESLALMQAATASVIETLDVMQDELGLPDAARIRPAELTVDPVATELTGQANKAAVAAVGAGVLVTLMMTALVDGVVARRSRNRSRSRSRSEGGRVVGPSEGPPPGDAVAEPTPTRLPTPAPTPATTPDEEDDLDDLDDLDEVTDHLEDEEEDEDRPVTASLHVSASR